MSKPIGKPLIGAFVLGAVAIVVAGIFVLGGGKFLKKKFMRVMYFDGSVKGLKVGAPVTFRGVKIGTVSDITIRANAQDLTTRIPVVVEVDPDSIETIIVPRARDLVDAQDRRAAADGGGVGVQRMRDL